MSKMEEEKHSLISELPLKKKKRKFPKQRRKRRSKRLYEMVQKMILGHRNVNSVMQELPESHPVICSSPDKIMEPSVNSLNQTIDLCTDDSLVNISANSRNELLKFPTNSSLLIDLSKDAHESKEVIDLTENSIVKETVETTVIDLSEDEDITSSNTKNDSDDILVIGTFSSYPPNKRPNGFVDQISNFLPWSKYSPKNNTLNKIKKRKLTPKKNGNNANTSGICGEVLLEKQVCVNGNPMVESKIESPLPQFKLCDIGENVYADAPVKLPKSGLRPIIIDGSNVAYGNQNNFSVKRLEICIKYFKEKGHKVTAFLPQYRIKFGKSDNKKRLTELVNSGDVILTPSKVIDGKNIVPYDDRFIVQTAVLKGGVIISRDNYLDLLKENPAWAETIKYRTLPFTWVDDLLMFPKDPLGEDGPTLEQFLRFDQVNT